jgi:hypothetical protein
MSRGANIRIEIEMATATTSIRAPRGTKALTQAFFSAAAATPEPQRAAVIKAALSGIRTELKTVREKASAAKAKAKSAAPAKKIASKPVKKAAPKAGAKSATPVKAGPKAKTTKRAAIEQIAAE